MWKTWGNGNDQGLRNREDEIFYIRIHKSSIVNLFLGGFDYCGEECSKRRLEVVKGSGAKPKFSKRNYVSLNVREVNFRIVSVEVQKIFHIGKFSKR